MHTIRKRRQKEEPILPICSISQSSWMRQISLLVILQVSTKIFFSTIEFFHEKEIFGLEDVCPIANKFAAAVASFCCVVAGLTYLRILLLLFRATRKLLDHNLRLGAQCATLYAFLCFLSSIFGSH